MTVTAGTARNDYNGNDVTTEFAVTFKFTLNSDVQAVLYNSVTAAETILVETTDYTLTGAGEDTGGTLTMIVAPATGETLTFTRNIAFSQTYDYIEHSTFPADSHEAALDKLTMLLQQLDEAMTRVLRQSISQSGSLELPPAISDMFLRWTADGSLVNFDISDLSLYSVTPYAGTILECEDATAAKSALEIDDVYTTTAQNTPDKTVKISTFTVFFGNSRIKYEGIASADMGAGGAFETTTLTASYYNKLLFVLNSSGTLIMYEGTPAATVNAVVEPEIPTDEFPICVILVQDDGSAAPGTILAISQSAITQTLRTNSAQFGVTMTDGQIMVGQTGADFQAKTISGDVTMTKTGVTTVTNTAMTDGQIMVGQTGSASEGKTISGDVTVDKDGVATVTNTAMTDGQIMVGQTGAASEGKTISGDVTVDEDGVATVSNTGAIGQADLKTSTGEVSCIGVGSMTNLPGGEYGFYPQIKYANTNGGTGKVGWALGHNNYDSTDDCWSDSSASGLTATGYTTGITIYSDQSNLTTYAGQRYITSSGEVHWVFLLRDLKTGLIVAAYQAPDHPCFGNGGKPLLVQHPFFGYDKDKYEIIVVNPFLSTIEEMTIATEVSDETKPDRSLLEVILNDYEISEYKEIWPDIPITTGLPKYIKQKGQKILVDYRFIDYRGKRIKPIKKIIKQSKDIKCLGLTKRR